MNTLDHLLTCSSCGPFGRHRRQRARRARTIAENALVAYWQRLGAQSRAERRAQRFWWVSHSGEAWPLAHDGELRNALVCVGLVSDYGGGAQ
ncbi:hypothetical protein MINS_12240 [Mycolicibacterium insubricum]|uniref:Uncharacterized protein n=1 Tax=Mycolicibacterium insubricum TaxID=444597 RepID=A0A1X0CKG4_9MYCO|nr:hypothetical protein [Mycolicibacterium insubricum]MCV7083289.1 hypothetical protein [Mycolicibacterium insubricum]ORA60469.1 hypothetical protein BST26_21480 [Mycolicibacterium insubricum]BBZ65795.1 hypothetical protein MINS_12240 [Mycolicibacterium insubricum]